MKIKALLVLCISILSGCGYRDVECNQRADKDKCYREIAAIENCRIIEQANERNVCIYYVNKYILQDSKK